MNAMHGLLPELRAIDLNQLVYLDTLLQLRSVSGAADVVGITQSAMSHALRRLREQFDDSLLVRIGSSMELTPFAEQLRPRLRTALVDLQRSISPAGPFDPSAQRRAFRIASPDLFDVLVLPALMQQLRKVGPGLSLRVSSYGRSDLEASIAEGAVDLALVPVLKGDQHEARDGFMRRSLFRDGFRCFLRADHPAVDPWDIDGWLAAGHLLVSPSGGTRGVVDVVLERIGRNRNVALQVEGFGVAPRIVANSDLILTAPASLARLTRPMGIVDLDPPVELPTHGIAMLWHQRFGDDPGLRWLMGQIENAIVGRVPWAA